MITLNQIKYGSLSILIISFLLFKFQIQLNIFYSILSTLCIIILISLYLFYRFKNFLKRAGYISEWHDLYGEKYINLPYYKDDKIINSFKKDDINYNKEIGEINEGKDYEKNNRNYYDLFIPYSTLKRKDKNNGVILFIHGGGWQFGKKEYTEYLTARYAKYGYITAQLNYTYLSKKDKKCNIFKILDEITSCLESVKEKLKNLGFNENKLELAIGGGSAGAHLSLLYGYSIKNIPIPLKFLINFVGPLSLEPKFWCKLAKNVPTLDSIERRDIEKGIKEKKIVGFYDDEFNLLNFMNIFLQDKYSDKELKEILVNKKIDLNNEKYKKMENILKYAYPINFVNKNSVPTLCIYGGDDSLIGIAHYSFLKQLSEQYGNKVELVYMKNGGHALGDYETENGKNALREMHYQILNFAKNYFDIDNWRNSVH